MVPDTRYGILGLLLKGPSNGYQVTKLFGELLGPGWEINSGQVYQTLGRLEADDWARCLSPPDEPKDSKIYRVTPKGEREFAKWLAEHPLRSRTHRDSLHLRLVLASHENADQLLEDIRIAKQTCVDKLAAYTSDACRLPEDAGEWETLAREAIDEDVSTELHGKLEWLEKVELRVKRLAERSQAASPAAGVEPALPHAASPAAGVEPPRGEAAA